MKRLRDKREQRAEETRESRELKRQERQERAEETLDRNKLSTSYTCMLHAPLYTVLLT